MLLTSLKLVTKINGIKLIFRANANSNLNLSIVAMMSLWLYAVGQNSLHRGKERLVLLLKQHMRLMMLTLLILKVWCLVMVGVRRLTLWQSTAPVRQHQRLLSSTHRSRSSDHRVRHGETETVVHHGAQTWSPAPHPASQVSHHCQWSPTMHQWG